MSVHSVQASESQRLAAEAQSRRRSLPPSLSVSVSQSVNQRWRERPRCPASPVTPGRRDGVVHAIVGRAACRCLRAQVVQDERAARVARVRVQIRRDEAARRIAQEIGSRASQCFPEGAPPLADPDPAADHRVFQAGAVLSLVNALRFASTRPAAGPSGIDDACRAARLGLLRDAGFLMAGAGREKRVDARFLQAYVDVSRLCPDGTSSASHPVHAERVSSRRPQGTIQAHPPQHRVRLLRRHAARESAHLTRDQADSLRRVVSKTKRR